MMESTVLTLRQRADINTACCNESGLEMSEETDMYKPLLNPNSALLFNVA